MSWVKAKLRNAEVYAKSNESGALVDDDGKVEVRYKPNDGRRYYALARNLAIVPGAPLPDDACGEASDAPKKDDKKPGGEKPTSTARARGAADATLGKFDASAVVIAYTDGACTGNPGPAGLGVILDDAGSRHEISEYLGEATNNIAELTAILRALEQAGADRVLHIHTDSQYAIGVLARGWKAKANVELIAKIRARIKEHPGLKLTYVKGHAGVPLNERADELAREAITRRASWSKQV